MKRPDQYNAYEASWKNASTSNVTLDHAASAMLAKSNQHHQGGDYYGVCLRGTIGPCKSLRQAIIRSGV